MAGVYCARAWGWNHLALLPPLCTHSGQLNNYSVGTVKVCIYKVGARASGMGARNIFYLVWHLCTNHGAHIFT
jgi:hypothetical protein